VSKLSSQIRVAYVIGQLTLGGTESQLLKLVRHLNHNKFNILVICLSKQAPLANSFIKSGCEVRILNREKRGRVLTFLDVYRLLKAFKADIVHAYAYASRVAIPVSKITFSKSKNIVSIRTQPERQTELWDYLINSFADCLLTNSKKAATQVHFGFHRAVPCQVIYNGIDLQEFDAEANRGITIGLPAGSESRVICVVARLHSVKRLDVLLDAFRIISREMVNVNLWVVGVGPERDKLVRQAESLGIGSKVVFWGQKKNIPAILSRVDVGVLSSYVEGLPNAIIEYMAAGLPVVATNVGGNSEVVIHGKTGLLVQKDDAESLADAILNVLNNPEMASHYGQAGRQRVTKFFSLERMIRETEAVYDELLSK